MKKTILISFVLAAFMAGNIAFGATDEKLNESVTNFEFVELLAMAIGVDVPAGSERLSREEYYEVLSNILAERGAANFVGKDPRGKVSCNFVAEVLYELLGEEENLTSEAKLKYLVEIGYLERCDRDTTVTLAFLADALNNPDLSDAIAEAYSPPEEGGPRNVAGAPGVVTESAASQI